MYSCVSVSASRCVLQCLLAFAACKQNAEEERNEKVEVLLLLLVFLPFYFSCLLLKLAYYVHQTKSTRSMYCCRGWYLLFTVVVVACWSLLLLCLCMCKMGMRLNNRVGLLLRNIDLLHVSSVGGTVLHCSGNILVLKRSVGVCG